MPLAIGLRVQEAVWIGQAKVTIIGTGAEVRLAIEAPAHIPIVRDEVKRREAARREAAWKEANRAQP